MPRPLQTVRRRIVSIPTIFFACVLYVTLLPALVLTGLVIGALRRLELVESSSYKDVIVAVDAMKDDGSSRYRP